MNSNYSQDPHLQNIFYKTKVLRKPITGIVSGYHELPYILIAPDDEDSSKTLEINGKVNVSPRFIISPSSMGESFKDVFDPETFDKDIQGRLFSFAYGSKKQLKIENKYFKVKSFKEKPDEHINKVHDQLLIQENIKTGLIFGPDFKYYPISLDRFINEIIDREFNV